MVKKQVRSGKSSLPSNDAILRHWRSVTEYGNGNGKRRFERDILTLLKVSRLTPGRVNGLIKRLHPSDLEGFLTSIEERASHADITHTNGEAQVRLFVIPVSGADDVIASLEVDPPFDEINDALKESGYLRHGRVALFGNTLSIPDLACASANQIFELATSAAEFLAGNQDVQGVREKLLDITSDEPGKSDLATRALVGGYWPQWDPLTGMSDGLEMATRSPSDGDDLSRLQSCHKKWERLARPIQEALDLKLGSPVAWHEARVYLLVEALDETLERSIRKNDLEASRSDIELEVGMVRDCIVINGYLGEEVVYNLEFHAGFIMPVLSSFMRVLDGKYHVRKWSEAT